MGDRLCILKKTIASTEISLPVITIGNLDRFSETDYRERCVERLMEILLDIDQYKYAGRLFIP
jgi:hypothetical protein